MHYKSSVKKYIAKEICPSIYPRTNDEKDLEITKKMFAGLLAERSHPEVS